MTTLQKIIHAQVTKGQISISGKKKKTGEKKAPGTSKENSISVCSTQTCGPEVVGNPQLEIKATTRPFPNSCPSPSPSQTNQPEVCRAG